MWKPDRFSEMLTAGQPIIIYMSSFVRCWQNKLSHKCRNVHIQKFQLENKTTGQETNKKKKKKENKQTNKTPKVAGWSR